MFGKNRLTVFVFRFFHEKKLVDGKVFWSEKGFSDGSENRFSDGSQKQDLDNPEIRRSGDLEIWRSGDLWISRSGDLEIWRSGGLERLHCHSPAWRSITCTTLPTLTQNQNEGLRLIK